MQKRLIVDNWLRFIIITAVLFCGCNSVPVARDVSQNQAIEIVALLNSHGIASVAEKKSGNKALYDVSVKQKWYPIATTLLKETGLPRKVEPTFSEIVAQKGLIPNSREVEALRLDHAMAVEIEEALRTHAGIDSVKVIVRMNFGNKSKPAVSVILQEREKGTIKKDEIIKSVMGIIPGLTAENISISISQNVPVGVRVGSKGVINKDGKVIAVPLVPFFFWYVPERSSMQITLVLIIFLVIIGLAGAVIGYFIGLSRDVEEKGLVESGGSALSIDNVKINLPEV